MTTVPASRSLWSYCFALFFLSLAVVLSVTMFPTLSRSVTSSVDATAQSEITTLAYDARNLGIIHHHAVPSSADVAAAARILHPLYPSLTASPHPSTSPLTLSYSLSGSGSDADLTLARATDAGGCAYARLSVSGVRIWVVPVVAVCSAGS